MNINKKNKKLKIIFLANTSWYFYNFRLSLIKFLIKNNFEIHLICPYDKFTKKLIQEGIIVHTWNFKGTSLDIFKEIKSIFYLYNIYKSIKPDLVHHFTIKCVLYGTLISNICGVKYIFNSITGLGRIFVSTKLKDKFLKFIILPFYKFIIKKSKVNIVFQNQSDMNYFIKLNITSHKNSYLINGSGIDINYFKNEKSINSFPKKREWKLLFPSRLILEKGIIELIKACDSIWEKNKNFKLFIAGGSDIHQRGNISKRYIEKIRSRPYIENIKYVQDMKSLYLDTDIVILPSWREGLSRALLEAGSMELPIITSNVPGCKEIVINNKTGLLINKKDPESIKKAILLLMNNNNLCKIFSKNVRIHIEKNFTNEIINKKTINLYRGIIEI